MLRDFDIVELQADELYTFMFAPRQVAGSDQSGSFARPGTSSSSLFCSPLALWASRRQEQADVALCDHRGVVPALWASSLVGRRSYRNTKAVLNDIILRGRLVGIPLIATDGLLRGDRSPHGSRLRLRSSDQDSAEQSCRPSRTARQDRHDESLGGSTVGVGGFREPERAHTSFVERLNLTVIVYRSGLTKGTGVLSGARRIDVTMSITRIPL